MKKEKEEDDPATDCLLEFCQANYSEQESTHRDDYSAFFEEIIGDARLKQNLINELALKGNVFTSTSQNQYQIQICVVDHSLDFQVLLLHVQIGSFTMQLTVLNSRGESHIHSLKNISSTSASVYVSSFLLQNCVVKCIPIKNCQFDEQLIAVIKEFALLKIASILKVGPKLTSLFGFDLIVFQNCIQFCMEKCITVRSITAEHCFQLKKKLQQLHALQIVHMDVKPANICISPEIDEPVFIDYGLSEIIRQKVGFTSRTTFIGSLSYCSPEMFDCYNKTQPQAVDLYYNDVYALKKALSQLRFQQENQPKNYFWANQQYDFQEEIHLKDYEYIKTIQFFFQLNNLRQKIFVNSNDIFIKPQYHPLLQRYHLLILKYLTKLNFSPYLQKVYDFYHQNMGLQQFQQRKKIEKFKITQYGWRQGQEKEDLFRFPNFLKRFRVSRTQSKNKILNLKDQSLKQLVLSKELAMKIQKQIYFDHYVYFMNFSSSISTLPQKIQASSIMLSILHLNANSQQNQFVLIEACMRYLLSYYIQSDDENCYRTIPILLCNLIVIDQMRESEMIDYLMKITEKKGKNKFKYVMMIFRCSWIAQWIKAKFSSKYKIRSLVSKIQEIIFIRIKLLQTIQQQQNYYFIKNILRLIIFSHYSVQVQEEQILIANQFEKRMRVANFIEPETKREVFIHLYYLRLKYFVAKNNFEMALRSYKQIFLQQKKINHKYKKFEYYHFYLFQFLIQSNNEKGVRYLMNNLQVCLGSETLFRKYNLYFKCLSFEFKQRNQISTEIYSYLLERLRQFHKEGEAELLFLINQILMQKDSNERKLEKSKIYFDIIEQLKRKYPIASSCKISEQQDVMGGFYKLNYYKIRIMHFIFGSSQQLFGFFWKLKDQLTISSNKLLCVYCKQSAEGYITLIQAYVLSKMNKSHQIVRLYHKFITQAYGYHHSGLSMLIMEALKWFILNETSLYHYNEEAIASFYGWIKFKDIWKDLFLLLPLYIDTLVSVYQYLLSKNNFEDFWEANQKLVQVISAYPLKEHIMAYSLALMKSFDLFESIMESFITFIKENRMFQREDCTYIILLKVIIISIWPKKDNSFMKTFKSTFKSIESVSFYAKNHVKNYLFNDIVRLEMFQISKLLGKQRKSKSRQIKYHYRMHLKYSVSKVEWNDFSNHICNISKLKKKGKAPSALIYFLRQYFNNVRIKNIKKNCPYFFESPFERYKQININD